MKFRRLHPGSARGMTLMEMMVAVVVLTILIVAFGTVLSQAQRVVSQSETTIRGNASAAAIAQVIRADIRQASRNGFLCLATNTATSPTSSILLFTTAAASPSKITADSGNASLTTLGLCSNAAFAGRFILFHQSFVLSGSTTHDDILPYDFSDIQRMDTATLRTLLTNTTPPGLLLQRPATLSIPPATVADVTSLWQALCNNVANLDITWTDGSTNANVMNWYPPTQTVGSIAPTAYTYGPYVGQYVLFTQNNQALWPKAIKVRFTMNDPTRASDQGVYDATAATGGYTRSYQSYEVICPLGQ